MDRNDTCLICDRPTDTLGIFSLRVRNGHVSNHVYPLIESVSKHLSNLQVFSSGPLDEEDRKKLERYTACVNVTDSKDNECRWVGPITRFNTREYLSSYRNLILFDDGAYGPLCPIDDIVNRMYGEPVDFWGFSAEPGTIEDPEGLRTTPPYIHGEFLAFKRTILGFDGFYEFWNRPSVRDSEDADSNYEKEITAFLEQNGFKWRAFVDYSKMKNRGKGPIPYDILMPYDSICMFKNPFLLRKAFSTCASDLLKHTSGYGLRSVMEHIDRETEYPVDLIWDDILHQFSICDLKDSMKLIEIVPSRGNDDRPIGKKACVIAHLFYEDKLDESIPYLKNIPEGIDLYVTTSSEMKKQIIKRLLESDGIGYRSIIVCRNRGREQAALLVECREIVKGYDYLCFLHDKKTPGLISSTYASGSAFQNVLFENLLSSGGFIRRVIELFENNPRLGLLSPPNPRHGIYSSTIGMEWTCNFEEELKLFDKLGADVSLLDATKQPFTLGTSFWCRTDALKKLFDYDWRYDDFDSEPIVPDGTMMHAIERSFAFLAQENGYYSEWIMSDRYASTDLQNLQMISETLMSVCRRISGRVQAYDEYGPIFEDAMSRKR